MNDANDPLARLLRAAAAGHRRANIELPAGLVTRVLAARRTGDEDDVAARWFATLCQRAVLCASAAACACLLLNLSAVKNFAQRHAWHADEVRLAEAAWPSQFP